MQADTVADHLLGMLASPWLPEKPSAAAFDQGLETLLAVADKYNLCVQRGRRCISKRKQAGFFKGMKLRIAQADGAYLFDDKMIVLKDLEAELLTPVLAHELGHFFLDHHGQDTKQEVQAEATAFLMLDALGLANPVFTSNYICQENNHSALQAVAVWKTIQQKSLQAVEEVQRQHVLSQGTLLTETPRL